MLIKILSLDYNESIGQMNPHYRLYSVGMEYGTMKISYNRIKSLPSNPFLKPFNEGASTTARGKEFQVSNTLLDTKCCRWVVANFS